MTVTFPQIFLDFHPSRTFIMHVPINGISWKVTLDKMIYIWSMLHLSEETLLLGLFPPTFPLATYSRDSKFNTLTIVYLSSDHPTFSAKAQYIIWALILTLSNGIISQQLIFHIIVFIFSFLFFNYYYYYFFFFFFFLMNVNYKEKVWLQTFLKLSRFILIRGN